MFPSKLGKVIVLQTPKQTGDGTYLVERVDDGDKKERHSILSKHVLGIQHVGDITTLWYILSERVSYRAIGDGWGK